MELHNKRSEKLEQQLVVDSTIPTTRPNTKNYNRIPDANISRISTPIAGYRASVKSVISSHLEGLVAKRRLGVAW
eukprot:7616167-Karenia_brevis.AAC.1